VISDLMLIGYSLGLTQKQLCNQIRSQRINTMHGQRTLNNMILAAEHAYDIGYAQETKTLIPKHVIIDTVPMAGLRNMHNCFVYEAYKCGIHTRKMEDS